MVAPPGRRGRFPDPQAPARVRTSGGVGARRAAAGALVDALELAECALVELDALDGRCRERFDEAACVVVGARARELDLVQVLVAMRQLSIAPSRPWASVRCVAIVSVSRCPA